MKSGLVGHSQGNLWESGFFGAVVWLKGEKRSCSPSPTPKSTWLLLYLAGSATIRVMGLQGILSRPILLALGLAEHRTRKPKPGPNISAFFLVDSQAGWKLNFKQLPNSNKQENKKTAKVFLLSLTDRS